MPAPGGHWLHDGRYYVTALFPLLTLTWQCISAQGHQGIILDPLLSLTHHMYSRTKSCSSFQIHHFTLTPANLT